MSNACIQTVYYQSDTYPKRPCIIEEEVIQSYISKFYFNINQSMIVLDCITLTIKSSYTMHVSFQYFCSSEMESI